MKIRPPSACNPARFARHCLARVTRDSSVRLLARERCGIRARCVRVLDARGNSRARARSSSSSFVRVRRRACMRPRVSNGSNNPRRRRARVVDEVDAEDTTATRTVEKASVRVATTRRGGRRAGNRRRRRRRDDEGTRELDARRVRGRDDARVHRFKRLHSCMHAFDSNASVGAFVALFEF